MEKSTQWYAWVYFAIAKKQTLVQPISNPAAAGMLYDIGLTSAPKKENINMRHLEDGL